MGMRVLSCSRRCDNPGETVTVSGSTILEMPQDVEIGAMPHYPHLLTWVKAEIEGLTEFQLDFGEWHPDREWM